MNFLSSDGGDTYTRCHCKCSIQDDLTRLTSILVWSNFEIGDLDFWRSEAYMKFFDFLDRKGGFYYEVQTPF
jgi:alpha 1,2-mannosyltransferase